jgi:hypothetical protein
VKTVATRLSLAISLSTLGRASLSGIAGLYLAFELLIVAPAACFGVAMGAALGWRAAAEVDASWRTTAIALTFTVMACAWLGLNLAAAAL